MDPNKFTSKTTSVQDKDGRTLLAQTSIQKRPVAEWEIDTVFKMAEMIQRINPKDPHYILKVANLLKGFEHSVKGDENHAALFRTRHFQTLEQFRKFFVSRTGHSETAAGWFTAKHNESRLRHFYHDTKDIPPECSPFKTPAGPYEQECYCWWIDGAYERPL